LTGTEAFTNNFIKKLQTLNNEDKAGKCMLFDLEIAVPNRGNQAKNGISTFSPGENLMCRVMGALKDYPV
jgi:hypothetical protein